MSNADEDPSHGKESKVIIEELMLITSSMLPYFKDELLKKSEGLILDLISAEQKLKETIHAQLSEEELSILELTKKKSSI